MGTDQEAVQQVLEASGHPSRVQDVVDELIRRGHTVDSAVAVVEGLIASGDVVLTNTYALEPA